MSGSMYIGALAEATGSTTKALRLYESLGLLSGIRRQGSYRIYSQRHVEQVKIIRHAQALGFKLSELQPLLGCGEETHWEGLVAHIRRKQAALRQEIARLQVLHGELEAAVIDIRHCFDARAANANPAESAA